jgi:hypothetical protein
LNPGERVRATTTIDELSRRAGPIGEAPSLAVMIAYRDAEGFVHYRTHTEKEYVPPHIDPQEAEVPGSAGCLHATLSRCSDRLRD